ncbi:MAG: hypothetical protein GY810_02345, partial [Aureispira sp.]|nr:hypothetical protein [Aureispira sp.]
MLWTFFYISFIFCIGSITTNAQDYIVQTKLFSTEDGLSHHTVKSFTQDSRGFIWMATPYGLNRYDGSNFEVYTKKTSGLQSNHINQVCLAPDGLLWLIYIRDIDTQLAIDVFDPIKKMAIPLEEHIQNIPYFEKGVAHDFIENTDKTLWFATNHELFEYNGNSIKSLIKLDDSLSLNIGVKLPSEKNEGGWLMTKTPKNKVVFIRFNQQGQQIDRSALYDVSNKFKASNIIRTAPDGSILFSITTIDKNNKELTTTYHKKPYQKATVFKYSTDQQYRHQRFSPFHQQLWCSNDLYSLDIFDLKGKRITHLDFEHKTPVHLTSSFFDNQGGYWLNFANKVSLNHIFPNKFKQFFQDNEPIMACRGIVQDKENNLYVSGSLGTYFIKKEDGTPKLLSTKNNENLDNALRVALLTNIDGSLWLTNEFNRLFHYNPQTQQWEIYSYGKDSNNIGHSHVVPYMNWALYKDQNQKIWIGHK